MSDLYHELNKLRNFSKAKTYSNFFKTEKGEYAEGDKFLGISVPDIRKICQDYPAENLKEIKAMLLSEFHEIRFSALVCLRNLYKKSDNKGKEKVFYFYLENTKKINNWDLVDTSAPYIVGDYLLNKKADRKILHELSKSENLWDRRISVISTFAFIKRGDFKDFLQIASRLLKDDHDLIQKAVGWMLREMGKIDEVSLILFLDKNYKKMPRTMLRYSIEKLDADKQYLYMNNLV